MKNLEFLSNKSLVVFMAIFLSFGFFVGPSNAEPFETASGKQSYMFGVFPFLPDVRLEGVFAPIAAELAKALGRPILYRSAASFETFMKRLEEQTYDIAFIQPFDYVRIAKNAGYIPVAKRREKLNAVFVVREESRFAEFADLRGEIVAMAPEMAALSYLGKVALLHAGLDYNKDLSIRYQKDHHSCLQQVVIGNAAVCVTGKPAVRVYCNKTGAKLRIIAQTADIPSMLFVVHRRLPEKDRRIIEQTLLNTDLETVEPGLRTLLKKDANKPFITASDEEYALVEKYRQEIKRP